MLLQRVLQELESSQGLINLNDLSRKLDIERSALEGMIDFWLRKGRLEASFITALHCGLAALPDDTTIKNTCGRGSCPSSCRLMQSCSATTKPPDPVSL